MTKNAHIVRPTFTRAMADWQADLKQRGFLTRLHLVV